MTQNGLKWILNTTLKSMEFCRSDPPPWYGKFHTFFSFFFEGFPNLVHQITVRPGLVSAVLVTGKDLPSLGIDLPLGVTDLLDLPQDLESVSDAFLRCEGLHFSLVTPDSLDSPLSCKCSQPPWCTQCWAG